MALDMTKDMTTLLNNAAVVFTNQAKLARQAAADAVKGMDESPVNGDPTTVWQMKQRSNDLLAAAKVWDKRAKTARSGNLLFSPSEHADLSFTTTYRDLIQDCKASGRILITTDIDKTLEPVYESPPAPDRPASTDPMNGLADGQPRAWSTPRQGPGAAGPGKSGSGLDSRGLPDGS